MVIGQYTSHVSEGNRVTFPKRFSTEEGVSWLITKGLDANLIMVPSHKRSLLLEEIETKPFVDTRMRHRQSFVLGNTFEITLDKVNRFVIPPILFTYAGISKEVLFTGIEQFIQVWDSNRWDAYQKQMHATVLREYEERNDRE